jgi:hypothetical protein
MPVQTEPMTPASQKNPARVDVDVLYLNDLPQTMDKMGWTTSAKMMRRWLTTTPAYAMPQEIRGGISNGRPIDYTKLPASQVDDQIIKMDWVLGFDRVLADFETLCQHWNSAQGVIQLKKRLERAGWAEGKSARLGNTKQTAKELDWVAQVNSIPFGQYSDTFDDLYGAVFKATFKLALVGKISRSWLYKKDTFEIEKMGLYLRDTYDFNADWFTDIFAGLGIWSHDRLLTKKEMLIYKASSNYLNSVQFPGFVPVRNTDLKQLQKSRNQGGDFFVFSDVLWIPPNVEYISL